MVPSTTRRVLRAPLRCHLWARRLPGRGYGAEADRDAGCGRGPRRRHDGSGGPISDVAYLDERVDRRVGDGASGGGERHGDWDLGGHARCRRRKRASPAPWRHAEPGVGCVRGRHRRRPAAGSSPAGRARPGSAGAPGRTRPPTAAGARVLGHRAGQQLGQRAGHVGAPGRGGSSSMIRRASSPIDWRVHPASRERTDALEQRVQRGGERVDVGDRAGRRHPPTPPAARSAP